MSRMAAWRPWMLIGLVGSFLACSSPQSTPVPVSAALPYPDGTLHGQLANGFSYVIVPRPEPAGIVELRWLVDAGRVGENGRDVTNEEHLVEHLLFERTSRKLPDLLETLELDGNDFGRDRNATVTTAATIYYFRTRSREESLRRALTLLRSWADPLEVTPEDLELERRLIADEYRLRSADGMAGFGDPFQIYDDLGWVNHVLVSTVERIKALESVTVEELEALHAARYRPDGMTLVAVGDVSSPLVGEIEAFFGDLAPRATTPHEPGKRPSARESAEARTDLRQRLRLSEQEVSMGEVLLAFELPSGGEPETRSLRSRADRLEPYRKKVEASLAFDVLAERLQQADAVSRRGFQPQPGVALLEMGSTSRLPRLFEELRRVEQYGFEPSELASSKRDLETQAKNALFRALDDPAVQANRLAARLGDGDLLPSGERQFEAYRQILAATTPEDLESHVQRWLSGGLHLLVRPQAGGDLEEMRREQSRIMASSVDEPDISGPDPAPKKPWSPERTGTIEERRPIPELEAELWRLSNGARVYIKRTRGGRVHVGGISAGGWSVLEAGKVVDAAILSAKNQRIGVKFGGAPAKMEFAVEPRWERIDFILPVSHLDTLRERLNFFRFLAERNARKSEDLIKAQSQMNRASLARKPVFEILAGALRRLGSGADNLWRHPDPLDLLDAHPRKAGRIFRDRFADAGDFTFWIVGPIDDSNFERLATQIAGWPDSGRREQVIDRFGDLAAPAEPTILEVPVDVNKGGALGLSFAGDFEWRFGRGLGLRLTARALEAVVRDRLRSELGESYFIDSRSEFQAQPRGRYWLEVVATCAPGREHLLLEQASMATRAWIAALAAGDPDALRRLEESRAQELFELARLDGRAETWASRFERMAKYDLRPEDILGEAEQLRTMDAETLRDEALIFLDPGRLRSAASMPATR